jgi:hypothetical protein
MASSSMKYKTREDAKRARELDEARKAGMAPPELDAETGQAINPHIPQYMTSAPWYLNQEKPSLKHQKDWRVQDKLADRWYARGAKGRANVKFKKGACEKCAQRLCQILSGSCLWLCLLLTYHKLNLATPYSCHFPGLRWSGMHRNVGAMAQLGLAQFRIRLPRQNNIPI